MMIVVVVFVVIVLGICKGMDMDIQYNIQYNMKIFKDPNSYIEDLNYSPLEWESFSTTHRLFILGGVQSLSFIF